MSKVSSVEISDFLSSVSPFNTLSKSELKTLTLRACARSFVREETIYSEGDNAESVWILYQGRVRILKYTSQGSSLAVESLGSGELLGTLCRMGSQDCYYPCTAVAAQDSVILEIPNKVFEKFYKQNNDLMRGLCGLCSDRLKDVQNLRRLGQEPVAQRIALVLLRLQKVHGENLPFTKKEIAELAGTTIETTFRVLSIFQKKGLLVSVRGGIQIKKNKELQNLTH